MEDDNQERTLTQAERVISKFGGPKALVIALENAGYSRDVATIYKWTYAQSRGGTGGLIPTQALRYVLEAARIEGVMLTPNDLFPSKVA